MIGKQQFLDKSFRKRWLCDEPEKIENYDKAIADTTKTWIYHHRLEEFYTRAELKAMGLYYKRPEELIFVENEKEHKNLPHKGKGAATKNRKDLSKSVLCLETGFVYPSVNEAERQTGIGHCRISRCCLGKQKTANGYHWQFVN